MNPHALEILLVEDNPGDLQLTLRALKKSHLVNHIEVARDGAEALDFIFCQGVHSTRRIEDAPKLILLDLKLPKIDGLGVLKKIKEDPRTCRIPVVVLTTSKAEEDIIRSYELGVNSFIVKPVTFESLVELVRTLGRYWFQIVELPTTEN